MLNMNFFFYKNCYRDKASIKGNQNHSVSLLLKGHVRNESKPLLLTGLPKTKPYDQEHHTDTP